MSLRPIILSASVVPAGPTAQSLEIAYLLSPAPLASSVLSLPLPRGLPIGQVLFSLLILPTCGPFSLGPAWSSLFSSWSSLSSSWLHLPLTTPITRCCCSRHLTRQSHVKALLTAWPNSKLQGLVGMFFCMGVGPIASVFAVKTLAEDKLAFPREQDCGVGSLASVLAKYIVLIISFPPPPHPCVQYLVWFLKQKAFSFFAVV